MTKPALNEYERYFQSFQISEAYIDRYKRQRIVTLVVILAISLAWFYFNQEVVLERLRRSYILIAIIVSVVVIPRVALRRHLDQRIRKTKLIVDDRGINWFLKDTEKNTISWKDIGQIIAWETKAGEIRSLEIHRKNGKTIMVLGYAQMEKLLECIEYWLADQEKIRSRVLIIDKQDPLLPGACLLIVSGVLYGLYLSLGQVAIDIASGLFRYGIALAFFFYQPTARSDQKLVWIDMVFGCLFLIRAIILTFYEI